ncbi:phage minor head protein [Pseudomonas anguilliseptica]|uniref:Phage Mu protein F like protein n=1 Tax=Pseudomonas anguilliseptica TaxID=53406 RepID=A0A1H5A1Y7_PSEAG|nr:phage minor head protein [Pseudomonas anguilliseptica]SED36302.1 Phage Mu protein F like protein [Pseudomonas anguilliseptica]
MVDLVPLPPEEAVQYFRQKGFAVGFDYRDVWQAQHQAAFTVAKVMQLDLLQDIRAEVDRALAEGTTLRDFQQRLTPTLQAKGWWGRKEQLDPLTGNTREVQLGSPRRLKIIYDTNLRTAHSEGQWERIQARKDAFPYLEYDGNNSENPRLDHSGWDGLTLPVDHPFWQAHFPVKDYGCKCRAIQRTGRQVERSGKTIGPAPKVPSAPYVNARTGEVQQIPAGVHPSFHYPPGGRRAGLARHLVEKLDGAPASLARASIVDLVSGPAFSEWYSKPAGSFPLAFIGQAVAERLGAKTQLVALSEDTLAKQLRKHPEITQDEYTMVQTAIDRGREITDADGSLIYILEEDDGYVTVLKATKTGKAVFMSSLRRLSKDAAKRDRELQRLLRKAK